MVEAGRGGAGWRGAGGELCGASAGVRGGSDRGGEMGEEMENDVVVERRAGGKKN